MSDAGVETVGLALGGGGVVLALLLWSTVPQPWAGLVLLSAAVTAIAFSAGRHGRLSSRATAVVTAVGGLFMAAGGISLLAVAGGHEVLSLLIALAGIGCVFLAGIVEGVVPKAKLPEQSQTVLFATALGFGGLFVAGAVAAIPVMLAIVIGIEYAPTTGFAIQQAGMGLGFVLATLAFLLGTGRGLEYLDLEMLDRRDVGYLVAGTIAVLAVSTALGILYGLIGVEVGEHEIARRGRRLGPTLLLIAIPFAWLATALGEELLFRNGIQKYLTERFTPIAAILISSLIFAIAHIPAFSAGPVRAMLAPLFLIFVLSVILAVVYERTRNVVVTILIHGTYNALVYLQIYQQLAG